MASYDQTFDTSSSWTAPFDTTEVFIEAWGSGGNGGAGPTAVGETARGGGGGGGGAFASNTIAVTPGNTYTITVGATGGALSEVVGDSVTVRAAGGGNAPSNSMLGGAGGATGDSIGAITHAGGPGGNSSAATDTGGGGGGASAGRTNTGNTGGNNNVGDGGSGSTGANGGGNGGRGGNGGNNAQLNLGASAPGGGGGGAGGSQNGVGAGQAGRIILYWESAIETLDLQPDATAGKDTRIFVSQPTFNYGTTNTINAGRSSSNNLRGLIQFDISSIPAGSLIVTATLFLRCNGESSTVDRTVGVHRALTEWFEGASDGAAPGAGVNGSTWNLRNANGSVAWAGGAGGGSGSDFAVTATDSKLITAPSTVFNFNVAVDVQAWVDGTPNYGWWLINTAEGTTNSNKGFDSSDATTAGNRPRLLVEYLERTVPRLAMFYMRSRQ